MNEVKIIDIRTLAKAAYHLIGCDPKNHIDFYVEINDADRTVVECYTIAKTKFYDTTVILIGGYGGGVECVAIPAHIHGSKDEREIITEIENSISMFLINDELDAVGIQTGEAKIDWDIIPEIREKINNAETYKTE